MEERTAIDMSDLLAEVQVPDMDGALASFELRPAAVDQKDRDIFGQKKRTSWDKTNEARCDFYPKTRLIHRAGFWFFALWQKSEMGRKLTEIKNDGNEVGHFSQDVSTLIREVLGQFLFQGDWCIVTTPKRRHLERNFATLVAEDIGKKLGVPFYEDVAACHSRHRVNAEFELLYSPPQKNVILFDDFVTTGSTMKAMKVVLEAQKKNVILFAGINNKL